MITDQQVAESLKETQALHEHFRKVYGETEVGSHSCNTTAQCLSCGEQGLAYDVWHQEDSRPPFRGRIGPLACCLRFCAILCGHCGSITREEDDFHPLNEEYICDEGVYYWDVLKSLID